MLVTGPRYLNMYVDQCTGPSRAGHSPLCHVMVPDQRWYAGRCLFRHWNVAYITRLWDSQLQAYDRRLPRPMKLVLLFRICYRIACMTRQSFWASEPGARHEISGTSSMYISHIYQNIQTPQRSSAHPLLLFINQRLMINSRTLYPFRICATSVTSLSFPKGGGTSM